MKTDRVPAMFTKVLQSIVKPILLGHFVWKLPEPQGPPLSNKDPLSFKSFVNFNVFFFRVVQEMSVRVFRRNIDPRAIEPFLQTKIIEQSKVLKWQGQVKEFVKTSNAAKPASHVKPVDSRLETHTNSKSSVKKEIDEVQWIPDDATADKEAGNNDFDIENFDDSGADEDSGGDQEQNETMMSDQDLEFLTC